MDSVPRVKKLITKTQTLEASAKKPASVLSENKVTGWSLNFPIKGTCHPSKLCMETCYFAAGMTAWTNSLRKQLWNYEACVEDFTAFAEEVVSEYRKKIEGKTDFLRWNGGGDLFLEAVKALNYIGTNHPDVVIWVVTRKPLMAAMVGNFPNIYLHFSLDRESMGRYEETKKMMSQYDYGMEKRTFFSYQTGPGEVPDMKDLLSKVKLFFFDNYRVPPLFFSELDATRDERWDALCPLNTRRSSGQDIEGTCNECRKCFNGHWED